MITIFATPRPFVGPFDRIQRNGIKSWLALRPRCQIILFEDEEGTTKKVAGDLGVEYADGKRNEFGNLLLDSVFEEAAKRARGEVLAHIDADILVGSDFVRAVEGVKEKMGDKPFYMVGRRYDADIEDDLNFEDNQWEKWIKKIIEEKGKLHGLAGMDYWVFPKNFDFNPPSFVIGRPGMDSWLIGQARIRKIPVIDATLVVNIVHLNHNYPQQKKDFFSIETKRNLKLGGGYINMMTLRDADWILTKKGLQKPPFPRRIFSALSLFYPWRLLLAAKRKLQKFLP
jgi:hypothetical protein